MKLFLIPQNLFSFLYNLPSCVSFFDYCQIIKIGIEADYSYGTCIGFEIVFANISLIEFLIHHGSTLHYVCLMTGNVVVQIMIGLDTEVKKGAGHVSKAVEVDGDNTNREMALT